MNDNNPREKSFGKRINAKVREHRKQKLREYREEQDGRGEWRHPRWWTERYER